MSQTSEPAVIKRAEDMMRKMQAQFRQMEREAQAKDVALQQLMKQAHSSKSVSYCSQAAPYNYR